MSAETGRLVLIVDAHGLLASSLAVCLGHAGFSRVGTLDPDLLDLDDTDAVELVAGDIVLLGLLYGDGRTTLPLIRPLADRGCRVIVMMSDQGLPLAGECLHNGADAVLDKAMAFDRLLEVVRRFSDGGCALTEEERSSLLESLKRSGTPGAVLREPFKALTEREVQVFFALIRGTAPKQIATVNGVTISTVRGHIRGILAKLDVRSQREALAMARHAGWP